MMTRSALLLACALIAVVRAAPLQAEAPEVGLDELRANAAPPPNRVAPAAAIPPPVSHDNVRGEIPAPLHAKVAPAPKVTLLHMQDSVWFFKRLGDLTLANKRRYAERWRYDLVVSGPQGSEGVQRRVECEHGHPPPCFAPDKAFDIDHSRAPTFGKIKLARAACASRPDHWLLWSDADALVVNQSIPLESIIDDGYDIIFAYDWLMMNAGMLLLKCSPWTESFLARVYNARKFDTARALDQSSIQEHLNALPQAERGAHLKIIPKYALNVYLEEYRPGDFLVHMAGKLYEATEPGLYAITSQLDVLSQMDDIRDVSAFFDTVHLLNYYSGTCNRTINPSNPTCNPDDKRRIRLKEPLITMSRPNRYRHVHMRYYWMPNWQDKYDVPNWNAKKKALPMPIDSHRSETAILAEELEHIAKLGIRKASLQKKPDIVKAAADKAAADKAAADKAAAGKAAAGKASAGIDTKPHVDNASSHKDNTEGDDDNDDNVQLEAMKQQVQGRQDTKGQQDLSAQEHEEPPEAGGGYLGYFFAILFLPCLAAVVLMVLRKRQRSLKLH